ncbi:MAG: phosphotransferase family protein, partial [Clostridia bacterium]|nr:phosphotransferase family protein [Clostridia bacterium]
MAELVRQIEENDLPAVRKLLEKAGRENTYDSIERLGGMTNHSYKVTLKDGEELLVRIPGDGTEEMINRADEEKSTRLAVSLGIDSELLYFGLDGTKVMKFIYNPQPMSEEVMRRPENLKQAAEIFHKLHYSGVDTGVKFDVFEMADLYERIIRDGGVALYPDYEEVKNTVMSIKAAVDARGGVRIVPCHNDSLVGNWVLNGNGKLYLIDWEYSGM